MTNNSEPEEIYTTIRMTNSLSPHWSGKIIDLGFTKKQYNRYLLQRISWFRVAKTILIVLGIIGFFLFKPLFIVCGAICLAIDVYTFCVKKMSLYFIIIYLVGLAYFGSWYGLIYASFLLGIINLVMRFSFYKLPYEINIDKIKAQSKKVSRAYEKQ